MDTILINNSQNIQTEKSMATKSLNLKTHFSEIKKEWADAKSGEKKKWCGILHFFMTDGFKRINEVSAEFLECG